MLIYLVLLYNLILLAILSYLREKSTANPPKTDIIVERVVNVTIYK